jgi:peptidoglycan/LPS O-acetylase OafA/YrhL
MHGLAVPHRSECTGIEHRWASDSAAEPEGREYYPAFDYLRIVLATVVAAGHSGFIIWNESGNFSVQIFFALSGWLIGGILIRSDPVDLPRFYFNRAARIWIPYMVAIALLMTASLMKEQITAKWIEIFFYDIMFVYNFFGPPQLAAQREAMPLEATGNHFWSICAEEQFYLLAPILIIMLPRKFGKNVWFWGILSTIALASPYWGYFSSISLGALAAVSKEKYGDWHSTRCARLILGVIALVGFSAISMNLVAYRIGAPLAAICIVLFVARAGQRSELASFVGGVSFPMYLNHWIGVFVANAAFNTFGARGTWYCHLSGVLIAFAAATVLYLVVDCNVRKTRERFFTVFRGKILAAAGGALIAFGILGGVGLAITTG